MSGRLGSRLNAADGDAHYFPGAHVMDAGADGFRSAHRDRPSNEGRRRRSGLEQRGCERAPDGLLHRKLGAGEAESDDVADAQSVTGSGLELSCADEGAVPAAGVLNIPARLFKEEAGVFPGHRLCCVTFHEDAAGRVAADECVGAVEAMRLAGALFEKGEVRH